MKLPINIAGTFLNISDSLMRMRLINENDFVTNFEQNKFIVLALSTDEPHCHSTALVQYFFREWDTCRCRARVVLMLLILKAPSKNCSRRHFNFLLLSF